MEGRKEGATHRDVREGGVRNGESEWLGGGVKAHD